VFHLVERSQSSHFCFISFCIRSSRLTSHMTALHGFPNFSNVSDFSII
jgi:hypothetical protein